MILPSSCDNFGPPFPPRTHKLSDLTRDKIAKPADYAKRQRNENSMDEGEWYHIFVVDWAAFCTPMKGPHRACGGRRMARLAGQIHWG